MEENKVQSVIYKQQLDEIVRPNDIGVGHVLTGLDDVLTRARRETLRAASAKLPSNPSKADFRLAAVRALVAEDDAAAHLFGGGFVILQALIAETMFAIEMLHSMAATDEKTLALLPDDPVAIRAHSPTNRSPSQIDLVWAGANFYKHHNEWPDDWEEAKPGSLQAKNIAVLQSIGLWSNLGVDAVLRSVLNALLGDGFTLRRVGDEVVGAWRQSLGQLARTELVNHKLIEA